jgi:hypothetical protein
MPYRLKLTLYLSTAATVALFVAVVLALYRRAVNLGLAVVAAFLTIVIVQRAMRDGPSHAVRVSPTTEKAELGFFARATILRSGRR